MLLFSPTYSFPAGETVQYRVKGGGGESGGKEEGRKHSLAARLPTVRPLAQKKGKEEEDFATPPAIFAPSLAARSEIRH